MSNLAQQLSKKQNVKIEKSNEKMSFKKSSFIFVSISLNNTRNVMKNKKIVRFLFERSKNNTTIVNDVIEILNCRFVAVNIDHLTIFDMND